MVHKFWNDENIIPVLSQIWDQQKQIFGNGPKNKDFFVLDFTGVSAVPTQQNLFWYPDLINYSFF